MESKFFNVLDGLIKLNEAYAIMEAGNVTPDEITKLEQLADQIKDFILVASDKISEFQSSEMKKQSSEKIDPTIRTKFNALKNDLQKMISRSNDIKKYLDVQKAKLK